MSQPRSLAVESFDAVLQGIHLPMGLRVAKVKLTGSHVKLTHPPFAAETVEPGRLEVFINQEDVAEFLNKLSPGGLKNISVEAKNGVLHVDATKTVLIEVKAHAVCSLRIVDKQKLFVDLESVEMLGASPKQLIQSQLDKVNPIVSASDLPFPAELDSIEVSHGGITLRGRVSPPK